MKKNRVIEKITKNIRETKPHMLIGAAAMMVFDCQGCADCCKNNEMIAVNNEDCIQLAKALGISRKDFIRDHTIPHRQFRALKTPCEFLTSDRKCSVYQNRPLVCRTCPIIAPMFIERGELGWSQDCPGINKLVEEMRGIEVTDEVKEFMQKCSPQQEFLFNAMLWLYYIRLTRGDEVADRYSKLMGIKSGYENDEEMHQMVKMLLVSLIDFSQYRASTT